MSKKIFITRERQGKGFCKIWLIGDGKSLWYCRDNDEWLYSRSTDYIGIIVDINEIRQIFGVNLKKGQCVRIDNFQCFFTDFKDYKIERNKNE